jgi:hypothetical protein
MNNQDETLTRFAARHRLRAAAALIQILNDEDASASARVSASQQILAYSDGKPGASKRITRTDVLAMDQDERLELWQWLFDIEQGRLPPFIVQQVEQVVAREAARLSSPERASSTYTRMAPSPAQRRAPLPHIPSTANVPRAPASARQGPNFGGPMAAHSSLPPARLKRALKWH